MKYTKMHAWMSISLLVFLVLACNFPTPTAVAPGDGTPGEGSPTATTDPGGLPPTATTEGQVTVTPSPEVTPTEAPPVEGEDGCKLQAAYVGDVTIPDDTVLEKGEAFVKTWRIRNSGTCDWEEGTRFVFVSEEAMGAPNSIAVPATKAGATVDISVDMKAPTSPGTYKSNWQLETPEKVRFGGIFYLRIVVEEEPTKTPTQTATPDITLPTNFTAEVADTCVSVTFSWTDGKGEAGYRLEAPALAKTLSADSTSYTWNGPVTGEYTVDLIALNDAGQELGRVSVDIAVVCGGGSPDLIIESVVFAPASPVADLPLKVTIRVKNQGGDAAGSFVLRWWGGSEFSSPSCEWTIDSLALGATIEKQCDDFIYNSPYGSITTKAEVDVNDTVDEAFENNNVYEKGISVLKPKEVYNFVEKASVAYWQSGSPTVDLTWNGDPGDEDGFARWATGKLETGGTIQGHCLETHPKWGADGWITGAYTDLYNSGYTIQEGDRFYAKVGLLDGAGAGNVNFVVILRTETSGNITIANLNDAYDDTLRTISVDLSAYAGQRADVILRVNAGAVGSQDWACWLDAAIYRYP